MPDKIDQINKLIKALPLPKKGLYKLKDNINLDDYIAILQSKRENKTYTIDASLLNQGGGSSALLPNGVKQVGVSRDLTTDDVGYLLSLAADVIVQPAEGITLAEGDIIGITGTLTSSFKIENDASLAVHMLSDTFYQNEIVVLSATNADGLETILVPISTTLIADGDVYKTALRYLYDQSQNAIPLGGTEVGKPVTGDIEIDGSATNFELFSLEEDSNVKSYLHFEKLSDHVSMGVIDLDDNKETSIKLDVSGILLTAPVSSEGITGSNDFTANAKLNPNSYVQYAGLGYRGTATLSSGTVIVSTDKVKTGYKIYVSVNTPSGTQGFLSASTADIVDVTSFVINSTSVLDNSTVNWWIAP